MEYLALIIIILFLFISILILLSSIISIKYQSQPKYIYRYVPKKFLDQEYYDNLPSDIFKTMFSSASPWTVDNTTYRDFNKSENVNKYFISQI